MRLIVLSCLLVCFLASPAWSQFGKKDAAPASPAAPGAPGAAATAGPKQGKPIVLRYQVGVKIRAVGGPVGGMSGTFAIPSDWHDQEVKLVEEKLTPQVGQTSLRTSEGGLRQMTFSVPQIASGDQAEVLYTYEVTTYGSAAPTSTEGLVIPKSPGRDVKRYVQPSPLIEVTNGKIRAWAKEATEGKATAWEQVEALYDSVREKIKNENDRVKGAALTVRDGRGCKADVAAVFVALCRAHKVPARTVFVPESCHAEFYLEDAEGKGQWYPCTIDGEKGFGFFAYPTLIVQRGDNFKVAEHKDPQRFVAEHVTGKGGTGGRPEVKFVRSIIRP